MKMSRGQFVAIISSAQVRFGCNEAQAIRLAQAARADMGKLPDNTLFRLPISPGRGLFPALYVMRDKNAPAPILTTSLKLVWLLELVDAADKENIGLSTGSRVELTKDMADWLMPPPISGSNPTAPKTLATTPQQAQDRLPLVRTQLESIYPSKAVLPQPERSEPLVRRTGEREFFVSDLTSSRSGPNHYHSLRAECIVCHCDIKITLKAPANPPKYILEEARRLALIDHREIEHNPKRKPTPNEETGSD
jgi:hypothetical protein